MQNPLNLQYAAVEFPSFATHWNQNVLFDRPEDKSSNHILQYSLFENGGTMPKEVVCLISRTEDSWMNEGFKLAVVQVPTGVLLPWSPLSSTEVWDYLDRHIKTYRMAPVLNEFTSVDMVWTKQPISWTNVPKMEFEDNRIPGLWQRFYTIISPSFYNMFASNPTLFQRNVFNNLTETFNELVEEAGEKEEMERAAMAKAKEEAAASGEASGHYRLSRKKKMMGKAAAVYLPGMKKPAVKRHGAKNIQGASASYHGVHIPTGEEMRQVNTIWGTDPTA